MSSLLQSTNPDAADRINDGRRPMPLVGETVLYHPRAGEVRQGRLTVPAIVLKVDEENRHLEIMIIHDSGDMITQNRVPEHVEGDRGWSRMPAQTSAAAEVEELRQELTEYRKVVVKFLLGDFELPDGESVMSLIAKLDDRVGAIEDAPAKGAKAGDDAAALPKRRGRPRKS